MANMAGNDVACIASMAGLLLTILGVYGKDILEGAETLAERCFDTIYKA